MAKTTTKSKAGARKAPAAKKPVAKAAAKRPVAAKAQAEMNLSQLLVYAWIALIVIFLIVVVRAYGV